MGTEELPIVITSSDGTGQGISVINAHEPSKFTHVIFKNLSSSSNGSWELTGSLNFYESPVEFYKCEFLDNKKGDDLLNIIRSKFVMESSLFKLTFADALDIDFSNGEILNTSFLDCGVLSKNGDGIDASGSLIIIKNLKFDNIGNRALSVGENSMVKGDEVYIKNSRIAVASIDLSDVKIHKIKIDNSRVGFAVFQKKTEYGHSSLEAVELKMDGVDKPFLV